MRQTNFHSINIKAKTRMLIFLLFLSIFIPNMFNIRLDGFNITFGRTGVIVIFLLCFFRDEGKKYAYHKLEIICMAVFGFWIAYGIFLMLLLQTTHKNAIKELINIFFGVLIIYSIIHLIGKSEERLDYTVDIIRKLIIICILVGVVEIITGKHFATSCFRDPNHIKSLMKIYGNVNFHQATGFQYGTNDFSTFLTFFFPVFLVKDKRKIYDYFAIGGMVLICAMNSSTLCILAIILGIVLYLLKVKRVKIRYIIGIVVLFIILDTTFVRLVPQYGDRFSVTMELRNHLYNYQMGAGSSFKRFWTYIEGIRIAVDTFLIGIGPANYTNYVISHSVRKVLLNPHNLWLEILIEYGVLIFMLYMILLITIFTKMGQIYKKYNIWNALLIQIMLIDYLIIGIEPSTFLSYWYQWILIALGISTVKIFERKKNEKRKEQGSVICPGKSFSGYK